jgi:hypothetical protein
MPGQAGLMPEAAAAAAPAVVTANGATNKDKDRGGKGGKEDQRSRGQTLGRERGRKGCLPGNARATSIGGLGTVAGCGVVDAALSLDVVRRSSWHRCPISRLILFYFYFI